MLIGPSNFIAAITFDELYVLGVLFCSMLLLILRGNFTVIIPSWQKNYVLINLFCSMNYNSITTRCFTRTLIRILLPDLG